VCSILTFFGIVRSTSILHGLVGSPLHGPQPSRRLAPSWLFMEAAEQNRSFEDSGWRHRGSQGAAESSVESDAPSRDDGSMGSGESDAQVQHAQMRQGTAHGESESESEGSEAFNSAEVRRWPAPWARPGGARSLTSQSQKITISTTATNQGRRRMAWRCRRGSGCTNCAWKRQLRIRRAP
jgi:hypothetical protein